MSNIAVFPGSFDPVTLGHVNIIERAMPMFDRLIIAIGQNSSKKEYFTIEQRVQWLQEIYGADPRITIEVYSGLTINLCKRNHAGYILRGLRSAADYEYEYVIAQTNKQLAPGIETIFMLTAPEFGHISSSIVKEVLRHNGDISTMVPMVVHRDARK